MPMLRSYGGSGSTRRSPKRISPPSGCAKPATSRSSDVLPQPEGPSSVNSSPSATSNVARSTAVTPPKRLTTSRSAILTPGSRLLPDGLDVGPELRLQRLGALLRDRLVVDVRHLAIEVRAHAAGELHRELCGRAGRALHLVLRGDREEPALHEHLLAALGEEELDECPCGFGISRAGEYRHRLGRDERIPGRDELQVETRELLLERHVGRHGEPGRVLSLGDDRRHVTAPRGEVAGVRGELLEPVPALVLAVHGQDHLVRRVGRRRARRRALGDVALELRVQQVVPLLRLRDAETLDLLRMKDQSVRLERRADPEPVLILERDRLGLADRRGNLVPQRLRDLQLREQLLLRELLEERRLAAPEDVGVGPALPLDDAAVRHRRARRDRVRLQRDVPALLGVVGERLQRGIVDELRHRGDQRELALDRRLRGGGKRRPHGEGEEEREHSQSLHAESPLSGRAHPLDRSTARRQSAYSRSRAGASISGRNTVSIRWRSATAASEGQSPDPRPARYAAPSPVVSITRGRSTEAPMRSASNWQRNPLAAAPPSTFSSRMPAPASAAIASSTSRVWYAIASSAARARCARVVPRVRPTSVPRAYGSQYGAPRPVNAGTR